MNRRESWFYVDVYEISGTNPADAVAVKVNNQYHIARHDNFAFRGIMVAQILMKEAGEWLRFLQMMNSLFWNS